MNEILFIFHVLAIGVTTIGALFYGKESLVALTTVLAILANMFITKHVSLFGLDVTATDAYMIGTVLCLNLLQEFYGKQLAKKTIWISFGGLFFYTIASIIQISYTPSITDIHHPHFMAILNPMPRIAIASLSVFLFAQYIDWFLYGWFAKKTNNFFLRNYGSVTISQLIDTVLFSFLGLYGIVANITHIIVMSYSIKLITLLTATPFLTFAKTVLKNRRGSLS